MTAVILLLVAVLAATLITSEGERRRQRIPGLGCYNLFLWLAAIAAGVLLLSLASMATGTAP